MRISVSIALFIGLAVAANKADSFFQYPIEELRTVVNDAQVTYSNMSGIPFDKDMNCENCVRSGYDFCIFRTFPDNVTHGQSTNCSTQAQNPEINSVTNVNETTRWICSGAFKDQMDSIISMCNKDINPMAERNISLCGPYLIDLEYSSQVAVQSLINLAKGDSCTYRLHTKCGYPKLAWFAEANTLGEYDIIFNTRDGLTADDEDLFEIKETSNIGGSMQLQFNSGWNFSDINSGNVLYQSSKGELVSQAEVSNMLTCNGQDRNMYMTVTRANVTSASNGLLSQAPTSANNLQLVFSTHIPLFTMSAGLYSVAFSMGVTLFAVLSVFSF